MSVLLWGFLGGYLAIGAAFAGLGFWRGATLGEALWEGLLWPCLAFLFCLLIWMSWRENSKRKG